MVKIMTDRETIETLLKRAGIEWKTKASNPPEEDDSHIYVHRGYAGFVVSFEFNPDGSLKDVSAWE